MAMFNTLCNGPVLPPLHRVLVALNNVLAQGPFKSHVTSGLLQIVTSATKAQFYELYGKHTLP